MRHQLTILRQVAVRVGLCAGLLLLATAPGYAEIAPDTLPVLTGRVVDDAHVLEPDDRAALSATLKDLESQSGTQFVVATVSSLQGEEIEPFANALFRHWHLGQKDRNNGVLFLIAPTERKLRFEVGYGLEGTLTDALTKLILHNAVGPKLKANDFAGGIKAGVTEAIAVLTTDKASWQTRPALQTAPADQPLSTTAVVLILVGGLIVLIILYRVRRSINWTSMAAGSLIGGSGRGDRSSGGGSSDNFSGGGGDSGGGGSSDNY